ncbi:hypothetical protein HJA89_27810 [Rhizobium bangladeshense]|uniref:hypothetical protein n=1 Tax=Rhizobium TaxID=379 RepID=UPI001C835F84|nr:MULTISPECIES: hypothetical protein [Rhizobium]MBX4876647.1 hypothetical protein [Rhizobium bangladeshense]MBX4887573.1 hypothetical protein [Rhizobium bangladeshense]MBX5146370.1 hypothetical protein [Rhizobium lentis]
MPNTFVQAADEGLPNLTRRRFIGGVAVGSLPAAGIVRAVMPVQPVSIDEFLAKALPSERVRYHSKALAEAMAEMHPDESGWRVQADHEARFVMVARRLPKRRDV